MTRIAGDDTPQPPGGHAGERLREFIDQRFPDGTPAPERVPDQTADVQADAEQDETGSQLEGDDSEACQDPAAE